MNFRSFWRLVAPLNDISTFSHFFCHSEHLWTVIYISKFVLCDICLLFALYLPRGGLKTTPVIHFALNDISFVLAPSRHVIRLFYFFAIFEVATLSLWTPLPPDRFSEWLSEWLGMTFSESLLEYFFHPGGGSIFTPLHVGGVFPLIPEWNGMEYIYSLFRSDFP